MTSSEMATDGKQKFLFASFTQRAVAFSIDLVLLVCFHLGAAFVSCFSLFAGWSRLDIARLLNLSGSWLVSFVLIFLLTSLLYTTIMHAATGQTVGKRSMGIRLIAIDRSRPSVGQCLFRWIGYWLSGIPFGAGFFWVVLHKEGCGWHDAIAATRIIVDESPG